MASIAVAAALMASSVATGLAQPSPVTVLQGLNEPQDVLVGPDGTIYVSDSGTGNPGSGVEGRLIALAPGGTSEVIAQAPSTPDGPFFDGFAGLALLNGQLFAATSGWDGSETSARPDLAGTIVRIAGGKAAVVADTWKYEFVHNPDGYALETHPYHLAVGPSGMLWWTDASGNDLFKEDPTAGTMTLVTTFAELPASRPNPNRRGNKVRDPVPTGLVVRDDGTVLVAFLPGSPEPAGASKIVKVTPDGSVSDYATGFTTITDMKVGPDGRLYAVEIGNVHSGVANSGALVRVTPTGPDVVVGGLNFPTAVSFTAGGDALITVNGFGPAGAGKLVRYAAIATP